MPRDSMTRHLVLGLALATTVGACGKDGGDEFRDGVPQHEDVALAFPGGADAQQSGLTAAEGTSVAHSALLGERAELYKLTRAITVMVNGGTVAVLSLVRTITDYPPTSVAMDTAVWGPYFEPLSPNAWRLTVNRTAPGQFQYVLEAKPKAADDAAYLTILSGHHKLANPAAHRRAHLPAYGSGDFVLDWNAAQKLPEHDANVGSAAFVYDRSSPASDVNIQVTFTQVLDTDTGMLIDATYGYTSTPGMGGSFDFKLIKDFIATTAALETATIHSRWQESGAGRSDEKLVGGDLGVTEASANECWDASFGSTFMTNSYGDPAKMWGAESACAFPVAMYSAL